MNKGFSVTELFFWLAIFAFIIGGFVYKNSKEFQKSPSERGITDESSAANNVDRLRIDNFNKDKLINE